MRDAAGMPCQTVRSFWTAAWTAASSGAERPDIQSASEQDVQRSGRLAAGPTQAASDHRRSKHTGMGSRVAVVLVPVLAVTVLGVLAFHLLVQLAVQLAAADALGTVSVIAGMAVVLLTLLPFTLLWAQRAHRAWAALLMPGRAEPGRRASGPTGR